MSDPLSRIRSAGTQESDDNTTFAGSTSTGLGGLGSSTDATLQAAYSASPIFEEGLFGKITKTFQTALDGSKTFIIDFLQPDGTSGVNMDYSAAPNLADVVTSAGGGEPSSGYAPSVMSPGEIEGTVNTNYADLDPMTESTAPQGHLGGLGTVESPSISSGKSSYTLGTTYGKGYSPHYNNSSREEGDE